MIELWFSIPAAFIGGFLDAIVGGGGLILVPALFAAYPQLPPATVPIPCRIAARGILTHRAISIGADTGPAHSP